MKYKALSIVYPNGSKIASGEKTIEVRSWQPPADFSGDLLIVENLHFLRQPSEQDPEGRAVALVKIKNVRPYMAGDMLAACATRWEPGYYSWELKDVRPLKHESKVLAARDIYEIDLNIDGEKLQIGSLQTVRITVTNIQKSRDWYKELFNIEPVEDQDNFVSFKVGAINFDIAQADDKSPLSTGGSVAYWLVNDLDLLLQRIEALGGSVYRGPLKVPEIQRTILQVKDPFGNIIGFEAPL